MAQAQGVCMRATTNHNHEPHTFWALDEVCVRPQLSHRPLLDNSNLVRALDC